MHLSDRGKIKPPTGSGRRERISVNHNKFIIGIDSFNTSDTRGNSPSYGTSFQKLGHELMSRDELAVLDGGKCILQLRGVRPFLSDKYDLTQHPNYKLTSDYDPKNTFDIEKYLNRKEKIHPGDEFIVVDADSLPSA